MVFLTCLLFIATGIFYIIFAHREPPKAIDHLFRIDAIFVFLPEHNRVRIGRITTGALLLMAGVVLTGIETHDRILSMIYH